MAILDGFADATMLADQPLLQDLVIVGSADVHQIPEVSVCNFDVLAPEVLDKKPKLGNGEIDTHVNDLSIQLFWMRAEVPKSLHDSSPRDSSATLGSAVSTAQANVALLLVDVLR